MKLLRAQSIDGRIFRLLGDGSYHMTRLPAGDLNLEHRAAKHEPARASHIGAGAAIKQSPLRTAQSAAPSLARILRPQAAYRWLLPQVAAITPQYIEMTLRGALAGNHVAQWELFDLMLDSWPELSACQQELTYGVSRLKLIFEPFAEENCDPTPSAIERCKLVSAALRRMAPDPAADENDLEGTLKDILDGWFRGVTCLEVDWQSLTSAAHGPLLAPRATYWVHPVCFAFNAEGRVGLRLDSQDPHAPYSTFRSPHSPVAAFPPHKFLLGIHKAKSGSALGGALLRPLAWWWCAANFSADWLLNLAQVFGLPFRWANYDPTAAQETVDRICGMLQNMGSAGWAAFPTGTTMEMLETGQTGSDHSPQGELLDRADRYARLLILGQTMSGAQDASRGGGKAFGSVEADVKGDRIDAAGRYACRVLNTQLVPSILTLNYGDADEAPRLRLLNDEEGDLTSAERDQALAQAGVRIPVSFLRKKYGLPHPQEGEETIGGRPIAAGPAPGGGLLGRRSLTAPGAIAAAQSYDDVERWITVNGIHIPIRPGSHTAPSVADHEAWVNHPDTSATDILERQEAGEKWHAQRAKTNLSDEKNPTNIPPTYERSRESGSESEAILRPGQSGVAAAPDAGRGRGGSPAGVGQEGGGGGRDLSGGGDGGSGSRSGRRTPARGLGDAHHETPGAGEPRAKEAAREHSSDDARRSGGHDSGASETPQPSLRERLRQAEEQSQQGPFSRNPRRVGREVLRQERASGRLATTKQNPARRIAEGGEHYVELSEDGTRVIKHTKDGMFGLILDVDHSGKVYASIATASEYLDRIEAENKHFGTGYELEGSHRGESDREDGDKDGLTHSQPIFRTLPPNPEEIRRHLEGKGYRLVSNAVISEPTFHDVTYYHPEERRVVGDAKPDNFCRLSKDKLQALDLIVHDAPEDSDLHRVLSANLEPPLPPLKP